MAVTSLSEVIVPRTFDPYFRQMTDEKDDLLTSGAVVRSAFLDDWLSQNGGNIVDVPSWQDLDATTHTDDVATDDTTDITPAAVATSQETAVRLYRTAAWSHYQLAGVIAGDDPAAMVAEKVGFWWSRRRQTALLAVLAGVFADNDANDSGDYTNDISNSGSYSAGVTDVSGEAVIDTMGLMGHSWADLQIFWMHSQVFQRLQKQKLIDFRLDAETNINIPTYMGRDVVVNDAMPNPSTGVYHTYMLGPGAIQIGMAPGKRPSVVDFDESKGTGAGQETLYTRVQLALHPTGHRYVGAASGGGPANSVLDDAASWDRVYPERKQIKIARLITTEHS